MMVSIKAKKRGGKIVAELKWIVKIFTRLR